MLNRSKVSENQISLLLAEVAKAQQSSEKVSWVEISKLLNTEGPCIKSVKAWNGVNILIVI